MSRPEEQVKSGHFRHVNVKWYNSSSRNVKCKRGTGLWYRSGQGVVEVRWVCVVDKDGDIVPSLLALYTLVALVFHEFWKDNKEDWRKQTDMEIGYCGYDKEYMTFGDVLSYIRRLNFEQLILNTLSRLRGLRFIGSDLGKSILSQFAQWS